MFIVSSLTVGTDITLKVCMLLIIMYVFVYTGLWISYVPECAED